MSQNFKCFLSFSPSVFVSRYVAHSCNFFLFPKYVWLPLNFPEFFESRAFLAKVGGVGISRGIQGNSLSFGFQS